MSEGPYFKPDKAAAYCGQSKREWDTLLSLFDVPLSGPLANVYAKSTLDDLMAHPQKYLRAKKQKKTTTTDSRPVKDRVRAIMEQRSAG